jgi:hypothetical protein
LWFIKIYNIFMSKYVKNVLVNLTRGQASQKN